MAEAEQDEKTEEASSKRLSEAREKGQIPLSRELSSWVGFLGILIVVAWISPPMIRRLVTSLRVMIEMPPIAGMDDRQVQTMIFDLLGQAAMATGIAFCVILFFAVAGTMVQTGFFASLEKLTPDFERLSLSQGLKRIFSTTALVDFFKSVAKFLFLGTVVFFMLKPLLNDTPLMVQQGMIDSVIMAYHLMIKMIATILIVFGFIAVADLAYQRYQYYKSLRMTKTEVKDEHKQQEGDPAVKGRQRQMRMEKARKRMMSQVPKADVVITNPTHYAVALQYDGSKMAAPVVLAKGINLIAEKIKEIAEENAVPLVSNPPLARALHDTVDIDRPIQSEHYKAVAEVISYVYKLKKRKF